MRGVSHLAFILGAILAAVAVFFKLSGFSQSKGIPPFDVSPSSCMQFGQTMMIFGVGLMVCSLTTNSSDKDDDEE